MNWWEWTLVGVAAVLGLTWLAVGKDVNRYLRIRRM